MLSKLGNLLRRTAAWRLSAPTTVAFALGTAAAFFFVYLVVAEGIRERSDLWLKGESELLTEVVETTPAGDIYERLVDEIAERASHEVLPAQGEENAAGQSLFFLVTESKDEPQLWVGPEAQGAVLAAIKGAQFVPGRPWSLDVAGWKQPFRVVARLGSNGRVVFLGFLDENARLLLRKVATTFLEAWVVMLFFGFLISWLGARSILHRVEQITEAAAEVGAEGFDQRVPVEKGEDEISRLIETLNGMLDRVEGSVEQMRSFSDAVAHDLRSPVTSIRGNLEMALIDGKPDILAEAAGEAIESLDRLLRSLSTSLDVAEAEGGALRLHRKKVDLRVMARELVEVYRPAAEERGLAFKANGEGPAVAYVDPDLVRRALANLLDNAIQHLHPGCNVEVSATARGKMIVLSVADDGAGFPAELRQHAFERFVRGSGSKGSGLGLALARAAARAHGGEAVILDSPQGGALINLSLPSEPAPPA
ncbi:MAG: ATP-binding protein [Acidobacteriota bacterium]